MFFDVDHESRVRLEIDMKALRENFRTVKQYVAPCKVIAILKANAYGLGVLPIARALKQAGADGFGVAELNEALQLVGLGLPIRILGNLLPAEVMPAVNAGLICPVNDLAMAELLSAEAVRQRRIVYGQLTIDSGMGRLGMLAGRARREIVAISRLPNLQLTGIYSHCSSAFDGQDPFTVGQVEKMKRLLEELALDGIGFEEIHMAASDALNNFAETRQPPFNCVRAGFNLYGYYDNDVRRSMRLQPVVALKTRLAAVRVLPEGYSVGYGRTCVLPRETRVGTIAAGYADGLPLALSNTGAVLVRGRLCPILGRLSMDYTTVDLSAVPEAEWGDEVTCIGRDGDRQITLEEWARLKGTHVYDLLCSFGTRCARIYVEK